MDWSIFTSNLARTLPKITERCYVIIAGPEKMGGYVQFYADEDTLHAEAAAPEFVSNKAAHTSDSPEMLAAGWEAPTSLDLNWHQTLPLPALSSEFTQLAAQCGVALRDVYHLEPANLQYKAWREAEQQPPGVTWQPEQFERLDPGDPQLELPNLGLARLPQQ
ncbi:MAG: hypothetical protein WBO49_01055 [Candidatus Saccharimonas sp.]